MAKVPLRIEVVTQVEFNGVEVKAGQRGLLPLHPSAAHIWRRIVHGVGDDHRTTAVLTRQGRQMLRMITHPKRRQVQPHSYLPPRPAQLQDNLRYAAERVFLLAKAPPASDSHAPPVDDAAEKAQA
jgi:hypothetical protein